MLEVAGLVIGGVALCTVFSTIVEAVEILEKAKSQHGDLEYFEVMLRLQGIRLFVWAKAYAPLAARLQDDPFFRVNEEAICQSLKVMIKHITQALKLFEKHGFVSFSSRPTTPLLTMGPSQTSIGYHGSTKPSKQSLGLGHQHAAGLESAELIIRYFDQPPPTYTPMKPQLKPSKRQNVLVKLHLKTSWAISDTIALAEIIDRITKLTEAHEATLRGLETTAAQQTRQSWWRRGLRKLPGFKQKPSLPRPKTLASPSSSDVSIIEPAEIRRI